ncbi:MAG: hypothetical protein ACK4F0_03360 [Candidatus Ratteibacteria bacterium]
MKIRKNLANYKLEKEEVLYIKINEALGSFYLWFYISIFEIIIY